MQQSGWMRYDPDPVAFILIVDAYATKIKYDFRLVGKTKVAGK